MKFMRTEEKLLLQSDFFMQRNHGSTNLFEKFVYLSLLAIWSMTVCNFLMGCSSSCHAQTWPMLCPSNSSVKIFNSFLFNSLTRHFNTVPIFWIFWTPATCFSIHHIQIPNLTSLKINLYYCQNLWIFVWKFRNHWMIYIICDLFD